MGATQAPMMISHQQVSKCLRGNHSQGTVLVQEDVSPDSKPSLNLAGAAPGTHTSSVTSSTNKLLPLDSSVVVKKLMVGEVPARDRRSMGDASIQLDPVLVVVQRSEL